MHVWDMRVRDIDVKTRGMRIYLNDYDY